MVGIGYVAEFLLGGNESMHRTYTITVDESRDIVKLVDPMT